MSRLLLRGNGISGSYATTLSKRFGDRVIL
jgi:hypothetical protein